MKDINNLLKRRTVILDGATGTELQRRGMPQGVCPEIWCLKNPRVVNAVHSDYRKAGADVVYTCSFGANRIKLKSYRFTKVVEINKQLALLARRAVDKNAFVAGDIGPTGEFVQPFGPLAFEEAVSIFKQQVRGLLSGGVDLFVVETMMDIQEARAALIAVKEITNKFTIVTMTYEKDGRTLNGTDPITALITLQSLGADAVGCNCSTGPEDMLNFIKVMKPYAKVPLVAKPNAGMPSLRRGVTVFDMDPGEFSRSARKLVPAGAGILGGCCGTTPGHIAELKKKVGNGSPSRVKQESISALSSARKHLFINRDNAPASPLLVVGECINPTGKRILQDELGQGKTAFVRQLAKLQENAGADLLDVNVGLAGIDEKKTLISVVNLLSVSTDLPLVIDSAKVDAIEAALRVYPGRALINSISAEKDKLRGLLRIGAKYGAMFILLPLKGKEIAKTFQKRREVIKYIFKQAEKLGFTRNDIVVDGMAMAVSSHASSAQETVKTIAWVHNIFKGSTIIGLSNISFGMPKRVLINATFLVMARSSGLTMVIANPLSEQVINTKKALDMLMQQDKDSTSFLAHFAKTRFAPAKATLRGSVIQQKIFTAIVEGNREEIKQLIKQSLAAGTSANKLIHKIMIPAIDKVGDLFDKKEYFLPQLIAGAEAMKIGFQYLQPRLKRGALKKGKKTVVLLATVKGDIHDIGKNIVALLLKNHGFSVIDLGKDVSAARIIRAIKAHESSVVGLSALMTTTMVSMKEVIGLAKKKGLNCRFIVGGAVVTKSYARSLGAEYAHDGVDAVRVVKKLSN